MNHTNDVIQDLIHSTSENVVRSFSSLLNSTLKIHEFEIDCKLLHARFMTNDIRESEEFKTLFSTLLKDLNGPVVYWFEVISDTSVHDIHNSIKIYKGKFERPVPALRRSVPADFNSKILYVGKVKAGFWGRLITHMGFLAGIGQTQGLQLQSWAKEMDLILRLNVLPLNRELADYLTVIESALAKYMKPIVGKHQ